MLAPSGPYFWPPMLKPPQEAFFLPEPPPGPQNHVKTEVFAHRQDKIRRRREARNTVKKDGFEPTRKKHCKLRGRQVGRESSAAGAVSVYNLRLPPKALRAEHGRGAGARNCSGSSCCSSYWHVTCQEKAIPMFELTASHLHTFAQNSIRIIWLDVSSFNLLISTF